MKTAIHWSGLALVGGAVAFGLAIVLISVRPVIGATLSPDVAALGLLSAALLLLSLPAMYAVQADAAGSWGSWVTPSSPSDCSCSCLVAAAPLLQPSINGPIGEHPVVFVLGIALTIGLLLTGIATFQADVFPRPAALLLLGGMAGFFFVFFVAEFLPPAAGQIGTAVFGVLLALGLALDRRRALAPKPGDLSARARTSDGWRIPSTVSGSPVCCWPAAASCSCSWSVRRRSCHRRSGTGRRTSRCA